MSSPHLDHLQTLRPKLEVLAADRRHGALDRQLLELLDALAATRRAALERSDTMERIDALNTMRQDLAVAQAAEDAAAALRDCLDARTLLVSPPPA